MNQNLSQIITSLYNNQIGIFPCDTIWGLLGRMDLGVMERIFEIKNRDRSNPFLFLIPDPYFLPTLTEEVTPAAKEIIRKYWPGPLTIIFKKNKNIDSAYTAGKNTIAIRYPNFEPLNYVLGGVKQALISTSVNFSKQAFSHNLDEMPAEIKKQVDFIYDQISPPLNTPSTIIDCTLEKPLVVRPGAVEVKI